jgi:ribosomal protein L34E
MSEIYKAIIGVMSEIGAIGKEKTNSQQGFKYRGIDDVMNALQPLLIKNGVFVVPEVVEQTREDKVSAKGNPLIYSICKIKFTFYANDGSNITAVTIGEGMDSGDKATNKAMAIAFKYACFQVFCIPTEEMKDPDGESHELQKPDIIKCEDCGSEIKGYTSKSGKEMTALSVKQYSVKEHGRCLCFACQKKEKELAAIDTTGGETNTPKEAS